MPHLFNPLSHPIILSNPIRLTAFSGWQQHIPFAMFLVDLLRPNVFVELGTQYGDSYCAFCQAVKHLNLESRCYAIDSWEGDPQTGYYGPAVLADLRAHHDPLYGSFSRLTKSSFDGALNNFRDGSIDLLHIDGYHTYEAVKHDFEMWLPKMSDHGIILFHDTNVREGDFGVWRLWEDIKERYDHFEFVHGHGLGVLGVGKQYPTILRALFNATSEDTLKIRNFFFQLAQKLVLKTEYMTQLTAAQARFAQEKEELQGTVQAQQAKLSENERRFAELTQSRDRIAGELERLAGELDRLHNHLKLRDAELARIYASHGWKALLVYYWMRNKVLPDNSSRRLVAKAVFNSLINPRQVARILTFRRLSKLSSLVPTAPPVVTPECLEAIKTFVRMILPKEEERLIPVLPKVCELGTNGTLNLLNGLEARLDRLLRPAERTRVCWRTGYREDSALRILIVTGMFPSLMHGGGSRLFDIIAELSRRHEIDLYSGYLEDIDARSLELLGPSVNACRAVSYPMFTAEDVAGWLRRRGIPPRFYDVIQFEYSSSVPLIPRLKIYGRLSAFTLMESIARSRALKFVRDVSSDVTLAARSLGELIEDCETEKRGLELCDVGIAVTDADADFVARLGVSRPYVVPTCISKRLIGGSNEENGENESNSAVFVGYYHHQPNKEGLTWYLEEIHAKVRARIPGYKLYVLGAGPLQDLKARFGSDPSLVFVGQVEEILPAIRRARLGIAPLVSGAGIRGKINQYTAAGRPTVCTSLAASGMVYSDGESIIVRDTAESLAEGIVELLTDEDLWQRIRLGAIRVLETHYFWDVQIPRLEEIYRGCA